MLLSEMQVLFAALHRSEPYCENIHPRHGDPRPQRVPAKNFHPGDSEGEALTEVVTRYLSRHLDRPVQPAERYFLYYPHDTCMHPHTDPDPRGDHWRAGVVIEQTGGGGELRLGNWTHALSPGDAYFFRADEIQHAVSSVRNGHRIAWTIAYYVS